MSGLIVRRLMTDIDNASMLASVGIIAVVGHLIATIVDKTRAGRALVTFIGGHCWFRRDNLRSRH